METESAVAWAYRPLDVVDIAAAPEPPRFEVVKHVVGNVNGHDIWVCYQRRKDNPLSITSYRLDAPALRPEDGVGELGSPPRVFKLKEIEKSGSAGWRNLSPPGVELGWRNVLSSQPFAYTENERGTIAVRFLQYQQYSFASKAPRETNSYWGLPYDGWSGPEVVSIVTVTWLNGIGPVIGADHNVNGRLGERITQARQLIADEEQLERINALFYNLDEMIGRIQAEFAVKPQEPITIAQPAAVGKAIAA